MGNDQKDDCFYMHIQIIGKDMTNFYNTIKTTKKYRIIKEYWKIEKPDENSTLIEQINDYFNNIEELKINENNIRESLIIKVPNLQDEAIGFIIEKMDDLEETYYMPLVLLLYNEEIQNENQLKIDFEKYENIDPRLIFTEKYDENSFYIENNIEPILLRLCSIHNELGDRFSINNKEDYDLINNYFPFNLNIACLGRFGQGKSTGVNAILKEYKAKESSKGCSQTKSLTFYQVKNEPIRILDIPGFEDEKTIKQAIDTFKFCGEKINKIKDNLHIILYFLNYNETRAFMKLEVPMLMEIIKHKSSKIIYVITHSIPNMNEKKKKKVLEKINSGLKELFKNYESNKNKKEEINLRNENLIGQIENKDNIKAINILSSTLDNTVFVNFHKDNFGNKPFGENCLFQKIHDFFIDSEEYKNYSKELDSKIIDQRALRLRAEARDVLLSNKIWGAVVGIIPGVDWALQKFVIKKNAAKKVGRIFGIDVKFIDEEHKQVNIEEKDTKEEIIINSSIEKDLLNLEIEGKNLTKESNKYKIGNSIKVTTEAGAYIGSGVSIGSGISRAATASAEALAETATFGLQIVGTGLAAVGILIGVGLGGYFTSKYCEELLDKFTEYYKNNAEKIENSYQKAANYFNIKNTNI